MVRDSSEYQFDLDFIAAPGQRPVESLTVRGDAELRKVLVDHLDQDEANVGRVMANLQGPNSRVEVIPDLRVEGAHIQPAEIPLMIRAWETVAGKTVALSGTPVSISLIAEPLAVVSLLEIVTARWCRILLIPAGRTVR